MKLLEVSLETKGMAFLRFHKSCQLVATESGWPVHADILGYDGTWIYEIEIKRSFSDFKADFKKIKKHENMESDKGLSNYFWYLVDPSIQDKCLQYLESNEVSCKKYGLLTVSEDKDKFVESLRSARRIHDRKPHPTRIRDLQRRMSSELVGLRLSLDSMNNSMRSVTSILDQISRSREPFETFETEE